MAQHQFIKAEMKKMAFIIHLPNAVDLVISVFFLLRAITFKQGNPLCIILFFSFFFIYRCLDLFFFFFLNKFPDFILAAFTGISFSFNLNLS